VKREMKREGGRRGDWKEPTSFLLSSVSTFRLIEKGEKTTKEK